jgi:signal transduction histidine kinase
VAQQEFQRCARATLDRVHDLSKSVHEISHKLHPTKLGLTGLVSALDGLQRELSRPDVAITFTHENVPTDLAQHLTLCVFRVVQEALQNAIKHGGAHDILVHLSGSDAGLTLTVVDDGLGFDVNTAFGKGLGLISMQERLEAVHGTLKIRSTPGAGTRLKVTVPMRSDGPVKVAAV